MSWTRPFLTDRRTNCMCRNIPILTRPILEGIDGGFAPGVYAGGESDLDFQISYPIMCPQNSILFQTDDFFYAVRTLSCAMAYDM